MTERDPEQPKLNAATRLVRLGRDKSLTGPFVNPPVVHASTVLFDSVEDMLGGKQRWVYGRRGTPTHAALEAAIAELEGAEGAVLCPSGLSAISTALLALLSAGDEILVSDSVYGPTRTVLDRTISRFGIAARYYDPRIGADIAGLIGPQTRAIFVESPGSLTFEMQDVPAIAAAARARDLFVIADNTWATPLYFRPLDHGVDISVNAATKYIVGHSDVMIGTAAANARVWPRLKQTHGNLGLTVGPDDVYLALRGLRTMAVRLERQMASGITVARWLAERPEVARVLHPALETDAGHALWRRDMTGASGLFGVVFAGWSADRARRFVDALTLFGIGASWGGYESLVILAQPEQVRSAVPWRAEGPLIRLHVGLEDPGDLIADLEAALATSGT